MKARTFAIALLAVAASTATRLLAATYWDASGESTDWHLEENWDHNLPGGVSENVVPIYDNMYFTDDNRESTRKYEKDIVGERAFREIYLRGFERAVKEAKPWAIMTAYSGVNGYNCGEHYGLVTGILRDEWGFDGVTMTDWWTTVPLWRELAAGNDVKMPSDRGEMDMKAAKEGFGVALAERAEGLDCLTVEAVRTSAARVCRMVMKTRRFASEKVVSQSTSKSGMEAASLETWLPAESPN